jgi:hypothetical protein
MTFYLFGLFKVVRLIIHMKFIIFFHVILFSQSKPLLSKKAIALSKKNPQKQSFGLSEMIAYSYTDSIDP